MTKLKPGDDKKFIELPKTFFDVIKSENALVILSPTDAIVRIIPVESREVYKILINLGEKISPNFLLGLKSFLEETQINRFFTSGLCFRERECIYELYCSSDLLDKNQLLDRLEMLEGIESVEIQTLSLETTFESVYCVEGAV